MEKEKILIFINTFLPGYKAGGPTQSIANLSYILQEFYQVYIVCENHDIGEKQAYNEILSNCWTKYQNTDIKVFYVSDENRTITTYKNIIVEEDFDYVYLNSLWNLYFSIFPLFALLQNGFSGKIILSPRGELNPGALNIKKYKKQVFKYLFKLSGIARRVIWSATNELEADLIKTHFGEKSIVRVLTNIPKQFQTKLDFSKLSKEKVRFVFIARVSPMKNLTFLIKVLAQTKEPVFLDIYGPNEDKEYWHECQNLIKKYKLEKYINYQGLVRFDKVNDILSQYHFFIMPTKGENFGHAIFEAWLAGKPVIISNKTPWLNLEHKKIGWDIQLNDEKKWIEIIEQCNNIALEDYKILSRKSWNFAKSYNENPNLKNQVKALFS